MSFMCCWLASLVVAADSGTKLLVEVHYPQAPAVQRKGAKVQRRKVRGTESFRHQLKPFVYRPDLLVRSVTSWLLGME
jgi:hypothetical protein